MKRLIYIPAICIICLMVSAPSKADLFYSQSQYNKVLNEKVAVELQMNSLKRQAKNDKTNLESSIRDMQEQINGLKYDFDILKKGMQEKLDASAKRVQELENQTNILKKSGSDRERELIDEMKKQQANHDKELQEFQKKLNKEREENALALKKQREQCISNINDLGKTIDNLNDQLSDLKEMNKKQRQSLDRMKSQTEDMENLLKEEIAKGEIRLRKYHNKLIINIDDKISFDSGSSELKKEILPALNKIMNILEKYAEYRIVIEGDTDNVPIRTAKFRDNWQLSTERALAVLSYMLKTKQLDPQRFSAAGYGEYNPIVPNDTAANRALNRRVDIVVSPQAKE